ncbi:hypothetical protein K9U40_02305 [Xanthobacter autotrophicus]|uniref:hypothetical protein n=1 Tax=Xanthobacter TaxID=279 RepID=UPI0024AC7CAB|nr:hypothetical protein [Xanthobacter autotrophicus]MDI4663177.1 hypothetical protein [Xanthobacter autotrophicus]
MAVVATYVNGFHHIRMWHQNDKFYGKAWMAQSAVTPGDATALPSGNALPDLLARSLPPACRGGKRRIVAIFRVTLWRKIGCVRMGLNHSHSMVNGFELVL